MGNQLMTGLVNMRVTKNHMMSLSTQVAVWSPQSCWQVFSQLFASFLSMIATHAKQSRMLTARWTLRIAGYSWFMMFNHCEFSSLLVFDFAEVDASISSPIPPNPLEYSCWWWESTTFWQHQLLRIIKVTDFRQPATQLPIISRQAVINQVSTSDQSMINPCLTRPADPGRALQGSQCRVVSWEDKEQPLDNKTCALDEQRPRSRKGCCISA